jgi:succinate dehydrogenase/fumarate reductase flavoprotein subunit
MSSEKTEILTCDRRNLLKAAGIGMAAMALPFGMLTNSNAANADAIKQSAAVADVVIIGGGIAGVMAALKAREAGANVILIDKGTVGRSGLSPFFGAYNVFTGTNGSKEEWLESKVQGGEYLANQDYIEMFLDDSEARYNEMLEVGANINEGGRGHVHAWRAVLQKKGVKLIERTMATELIKLDGRVAGVAGFSLDDEKAVIVATKAVVLASGSGALKTPGFPCNSITHDGDCMAFRIGAEVTGKEFIDFHWTHWKDPAAMYDNWKDVLGGDMHVVNENMHGGAALDNALAVQAGNVPYLMGGGPAGPPPGGGNGEAPAGPPPGDGGGGPPGGKPPGVRDTSLPIAGGATAGMSAHKTEGIFPQNAKCESNIPGLYAAGDALATSGAAYVGVGTSSSASAVQGARAGGYAAEFAKKTKAIKISSAKNQEITTRMFAPRTAKQGFNPEWLTQVLQGVMVPYYVLYIKSEERLQAALSTVKYLRSRYESNLIATDIHELRRAHELKNMMLNSEMKLQAALMRKESRGSHFREDYPARDDKNWLSWIIITKEGENMKLSKREVPEKWKPSASLSYRDKYPSVFPGEDKFRS